MYNLTGPEHGCRLSHFKLKGRVVQTEDSRQTVPRTANTSRGPVHVTLLAAPGEVQYTTKLSETGPRLDYYIS